MLYRLELIQKNIEERIDDGSREALRERYGIKEGEIVFVYVGRIAKEKNIEELLWYQKSDKKI